MDKEKLREALANVFRRYIPDGYSSHPALVTDHNEAFLEIIFEAAQAHLATLDAVSKEDAELALTDFNMTLEREINHEDAESGFVVDDCFPDRTIKTIRTLLRAAAGAKP